MFEALLEVRNRASGPVDACAAMHEDGLGKRVVRAADASEFDGIEGRRLVIDNRDVLDREAVPAIVRRQIAVERGVEPQMLVGEQADDRLDAFLLDRGDSRVDDRLLDHFTNRRITGPGRTCEPIGNNVSNHGVPVIGCSSLIDAIVADTCDNGCRRPAANNKPVKISNFG